VIVKGFRFNVGDIISLKSDDGSDYPYFWNGDRSDYWSMNFSQLEPYLKTIRDAQVGDVVVEDGEEHMVLERWQNTVLLSQIDNFKRIGCIFTFDKLEEDFTLKNAPKVGETLLTMNEIAEKFGINISNLKITKD